MKKYRCLFALMILFISFPAIAFAFGGSFQKSLCDFPFGVHGQFSAYYDQRNYDPFYFPGSYPMGGLKLEFYIGKFDSFEERDKIVSKIFMVRYKNKSTGLSLIVKEPLLYTYLDLPAAEYVAWIGEHDMVIGHWSISVVTKQGIYKGSFEITNNMIEDQIPSQAVYPFVKEDTEGISVEAYPTNGTFYRARIFDSDDNITSQQDWWPDCQGRNQPCMMSFSYPEATGEDYRIETRILNQDWPLMIPDETCQAYEMNPGGMSRSSLNIKLEAP